MDSEAQVLIKDFFNNYPLINRKAGTKIIDADETPTDAYFIESGKIRQYDIGVTGSYLILNIYSKGAFFSVSWILGETKNKYYFETLTDCYYRKAPIKDVLKLLENSLVTLDLLRRISRGLDGLMLRLSTHMYGDPICKISAELMIEAKRFANDKSSNSRIINISVNELAARSGLARETVSRKLKILQDKKVIIKYHSNITIVDINSLETYIVQPINP